MSDWWLAFSKVTRVEGDGPPRQDPGAMRVLADLLAARPDGVDDFVQLWNHRRWCAADLVRQYTECRCDVHALATWLLEAHGEAFPPRPSAPRPTMLDPISFR